MGLRENKTGMEINGARQQKWGEKIQKPSLSLVKPLWER